MFCVKCGAKLEENAVFCAQCGTPVEGQKQQTVSEEGVAAASVMPAENKNKKTGMIVGIAVGAVAVVAALIVAMFMWFGGRSYEKTIEQLLETGLSGDIEGFLELIPDEVIDVSIAEQGYENKAELIEAGKESLQHEMDSIMGEEKELWALDYEITQAEPADAKLLKEIQKYYKLIGVEVSDAMSVEYDFHVNGEDHEGAVGMIKVGNSWYIEALSNIIGG